MISLGVLCRLHDRLNDGLFAGRLGRPYVDPVCGYCPPAVLLCYGDLTAAGALACYEGKYTHTERLMLGERIIFDRAFLLDIAAQRGAAAVERLTAVMLHEMIHQHLHETDRGHEMGSDNHGALFVKEGRAHGYEYGPAEGGPQGLLPAARRVVAGFVLADD